LQDSGGEPHPIPPYRHWAYYMKNGIAEAGMQLLEVPDVDWAEGLMYSEGSEQLKKWRDDVWEKTLKFVRQNLKNIDIFLTYLYPKQIDENAINEIKKLGIPCVNFYCDNIREFRSVPKQFKAFDLVWVPEYEAIPMYRKAGTAFINLPMPMWVEPRLRNSINPLEETKVSFIGSKDILREHLLSEVIGLGLDISIRGSDWMATKKVAPMLKNSAYKKLTNQFAFINEHGIKGWLIKNSRRGDLPPSAISPEHIFPKPGFDEYISLTQNSAITIGINRVPTFKQSNTHPLVYSRLRDIEAPMLGACYVTEHCEDVENLYELGKDILTYQTAAELVEKCNELLKDKVKRDQLRENGRKKALSELSIPALLTKLQVAIFK